MSQLDRYGHMMGKLGITFGVLKESIETDDNIIIYNCTKWKAKKLRMWIGWLDLKITKDNTYKGWLYENSRITVEGNSSDIRMLHYIIEKLNNGSFNV